MITKGMILLAISIVGLVSATIWLIVGLVNRRKKEASIVNKAIAGSFSIKGGAVSSFEDSHFDMATENITGEKESVVFSFESTTFSGGSKGETESMLHSNMTESVVADGDVIRGADYEKGTDSLTSSFTEHKASATEVQDKTEGFSSGYTAGLSEKSIRQ